jgi:hypothetical protein
MHIVVFFVVDLFDSLIQFVQVHLEIVEDIYLNIGIEKKTTKNI